MNKNIYGTFHQFTLYSIFMFSCFGILHSMKEEKAVSLALNGPKLQSLANRRKAVPLTCPMFDTTQCANLTKWY